MKTFLNTLQEATLSRVLQHMQEHDSGAMSAERKARDCGAGKAYTDAENKARMRSLKAKLMAKGYGIIRLKGVYEGGAEKSFFVFDQEDSGKLLADLKKLGTEFDQDSILFIPKGGKEGILHGTNKCPDSFPGWNKTQSVGKRFMGKDNEMYTSYVRNRPFVFETYVYGSGNGMGYWATSLAAKKHWSEFIGDE